MSDAALQLSIVEAGGGVVLLKETCSLRTIAQRSFSPRKEEVGWTDPSLGCKGWRRGVSG